MARILLIDDDANIIKLLTLVLSRAGFQIMAANTGEEGVKLAVQHAPDLAILDVMLPGMDGYTVCRKLRENPDTSWIPVLMLTAQSETRDKLAGFNAGADDYLTKPFEPDELTLRVKALLARSQMPANVAAATRQKQNGELWAVFGTKGGVGKTTLVANLAVIMAKQPNVRVAVMDADFSFGDVGAHFNLAPSHTILDLISHLDDMDADLYRKVLIRHDSNVNVLMGPYHPEDAERVTPEAVRRILYGLVSHYDYVIVDCASNYDERTLVVLEQADQILTILTPEIGPVKNTSTFLELASKLEISESKIRLILNRAGTEVGIGAAEIERALQKPIPIRLTSGGIAVVTSVNRGIPIAIQQPQHPFAQQVARAADVLRGSRPKSNA